MSFSTREVILLDSDSDSESSNPPKRLKTHASRPASIPPMTKPFMEETDGENSGISDSGEPNGSVDGAGGEGFDEFSSDEASDGTNASGRVRADGFGGRTTGNISPANGTATNGATDDVFSESSSDLAVDSSDIEELSASDFLPPNDNEVTGLETSVTHASVLETRQYLKKHGIKSFLRRYLGDYAETQTLIDLIVKLGYMPKNLPPEHTGQTFYRLLDILHSVMDRVRKLRPRIESFSTVPAVLHALRSSKKILVITGAGISTSLGIPDFRSTEGFYSKMADLGLSDPQEVFDIRVFRSDPNVFYSIAHMILPPDNLKAPLHMFIRLLQDKGILLRNYTQNIDNLEANAGILPEKMVQCHGSFATATCITCQYKTDGRDLFPAIRRKEIAYCPKCAKKRKQLLKRDNVDVSESFGVMKPDITFFGEDLPRAYHDQNRQDLKECDLLISIGTSLRVSPVSDMVDLVAENVPQILINKDAIEHCNFDVSFLGYCDDVVSYLCNQLGSDWAIDHPDYPELVGKDRNNLSVNTTEEKGVYTLHNEKREAEAAALPKVPAPEPDIVLLEPTV
ncbi:hypothetical protein JCM33374_g2715 [Metschnikowia sp. JCM 33374]|nr:hypothetical protein JCM33374_g2715 [Metschnikowia sp. JCM 33374]